MYQNVAYKPPNDHFANWSQQWRYIFRYNTLKNSIVEPPSTVPYLISVCLARSSADSIGDCILSTVRKAARLAVYDEMMISVKNHHTLPTIRPDIDLLNKWNKNSGEICGMLQ